MNTRDRIEGMILGHMYGDALGTPYEFGRQIELRPDNIVLKPIRHTSRFQGVLHGPAGQYSDDTEMAMTLLQSLINHQGQYDQEATVLKYLEWANSHIKTIGTNTRALFKGVTTYRGYRQRYRKQFATTKARQNAQSNGCLMRSYPLALVDTGDGDIVEMDCSITNPSDAVIEAEKRYVKALQSALKGQTIEEIRKTLGEADPDPHYLVRDMVSKGWYRHAMYCTSLALQMLQKGSNFDLCMRTIVSKGGDTDTNACIAGAMIGAVIGRQQMENDPNVSKNLTIILACDSTQGDYSRPPQYGPHALLELLEKTVKTFDKTVSIPPNLK